MTAQLFTPVEIRGVTLPNRIVVVRATVSDMPAERPSTAAPNRGTRCTTA